MLYISMVPDLNYMSVFHMCIKVVSFKRLEGWYLDI